jgi:hypothetical protein
MASCVQILQQLRTTLLHPTSARKEAGKGSKEEFLTDEQFLQFIAIVLNVPSDEDRFLDNPAPAKCFVAEST